MIFQGGEGGSGPGRPLWIHACNMKIDDAVHPGGGGGTLIFSCLRIGFKILNFNIFGGFQKK